MNKICLKAALKTALKGFSAWWIPLCIFSSVILLNQDWLPKYVVEQTDEWSQFDPYRKAYASFSKSLESNPVDLASVKRFQNDVLTITNRPGIQDQIRSFVFKVSIALICLVSVACVMYAVMIMVAKAAVSDGNEQHLRRDVRRTLPVSLSFLLLAFLKVMSMIVFIPGIYFYIRLMFTGLIITEKSANPLKAIAESWRLTRNDFAKIVQLFVICFVTDIFAIITIVGFIPAEPFKYTLRASVYKQLKDCDNE